MKILLKICYVLCLAIIFAFLGMYIGSLNVPEGSGLAGPGIVIGYGFIALLVGILGGIISLRFINLNTLKVVTGVMGIIVIALVIWAFVRASQNRSDVQQEEKELTPTAPAQDINIYFG